METGTNFVWNIRYPRSLSESFIMRHAPQSWASESIETPLEIKKRKAIFDHDFKKCESGVSCVYRHAINLRVKVKKVNTDKFYFYTVDSA